MASDGRDNCDNCDNSGCEPRQHDPRSYDPRHDDPRDPMSNERIHFLEVCWSFLDYWRDAWQNLQRFQGAVARLSEEDMAMWYLKSKVSPEKDMSIDQYMQAITVRMQVNTQFLQQFPTPEICGAIRCESHARAIFQKPKDHYVEERNASKVRSTLRQFVRDWAAEGKAERDFCYAPAIEALKRVMPPGIDPERQRKPRVLCPGSGLGRLPFDLLCSGYAAQQNEFSYHMILGSHLIFNRTADHDHVLFPYISDFQNRRNWEDNLKPIRVPDISLFDAMPEGAEMDFSMASGEFIEVYKDQIEEWDAVVTCFFLDTAKNIFLYIRTIASILRPGGAFVNLGPLLFHYADSDQISIELSWEEVRPAICKYFDIVEEKMHSANYTANINAMRRTKYNCVLFTAIRNSVPVTGSSNKIY